MDKVVEPIEIRCLGDYYETPKLRDICHSVKDGNDWPIWPILPELTNLIPKGCVIVPIPDNQGINEWICCEIARLLGASVSYCLQKSELYSLYNTKKERPVTEDDVNIEKIGNYGPYGAVVLFDNVVATGTTIKKCMKLIGKPCYVACIAVDWKTFNDYGLFK